MNQTPATTLAPSAPSAMDRLKAIGQSGVDFTQRGLKTASSSPKNTALAITAVLILMALINWGILLAVDFSKITDEDEKARISHLYNLSWFITITSVALAGFLFMKLS